MRYVFIVNPVAGKNSSAVAMGEKIRTYCREQGIEALFYQTDSCGHAQRIARAEVESGLPVRLYAVGGDGTLNEVAAGAAGFENAAVGVFPCGSGNDFIRAIGSADDFLDIGRQLCAPVRLIDRIDTGKQQALNVCSMGLDAEVAYHMNDFKKWPFVSGSMAYNLSLVKCLLTKMGCDLTVTIDGEKSYTGRFLFALAANGRWYGGGYHCAPEARIDDGKLDFILIRNPGLFRAIRLAGAYKAGEHLKNPVFAPLVTFVRGSMMQVQAPSPVCCNVDGECEEITEACFSINPASLRLIDPTLEVCDR